MASDGETNDGGSAADLLGGGAGGGDQGGGADASGGGQRGGGDEQQGGGDDKSGGDPEWLAHFSATADGEGSSNRDYLKAKGFKDLDGVVKSLRDTEKAVRESGRIKVPGEGATDEERAAFQRAIGVPEKADGYEVKVPEGVELNKPLIGRLAEAAVKSGIPKGAFEATVSEFIQAQMDEAHAETTRQDGLATAQLEKWGPLKDAKLAAVETTIRTLGWTKAELQALRAARGADGALRMLAQLGEGMAEDTLLGGDGKRFGISAAEAQTEIDKQNKEPGMLAKLNVKGSPEAVRRERLLAVIAAEKEKKTGRVILPTQPD